jgi:hypothetical protein
LALRKEVVFCGDFVSAYYGWEEGEDVEVKGDQVRKIKEKVQGMTDGQYGVRNSMLKD